MNDTNDQQAKDKEAAERAAKAKAEADKMNNDGKVEMVSEPLDLEALLKEAS